MPYQLIGDTRLYYEIVGTGTPLLFLHGFGGSGEDWRLQREYFADRFAVITPDLRGHGLSDKPNTPYSIPQMAADILQLTEALQITPAHLVGFSMGGMIALHMACEVPSLWRSVTVVNGNPQAIVDVWRLYQYFQRRFLRKTEFSKRRVVRQFVSQLGKNDNPEATPPYWQILRAFRQWSVLDRLHEITCPTLIVGSEDDFTDATYKRDYAAKIPHGQFVLLENAGHHVLSEHGERVNQIIGNFLMEIG